MKKTILVFVAGIFMCLSSATNAATTTDAKDASATKSEVKSNAKAAHTYYVVSRDDGDNTYNLSLTPPDGPCNGGPDPCQIATDDDFDATLKIDQTKVDSEMGVSIEGQRTL